MEEARPAKKLLWREIPKTLHTKRDGGMPTPFLFSIFTYPALMNVFHSYDLMHDNPGIVLQDC